MSNLTSDPFLQKTFFCLASTANPEPLLFVLCLDYLLTLGNERIAWFGNQELLFFACISCWLFFFVRKITGIYKSFWWIEPFIFRRKWMEQFGALGPPVALVWAPPAALTFYFPAYLVLSFTWPRWGTTGFSISKNNCFPLGRDKKDKCTRCRDNIIRSYIVVRLFYSL